MITDALILAEPYLKISDQIRDPNKYLYLTDHIMSQIEMSDIPVRCQSNPINYSKLLLTLTTGTGKIS